MLRYVLSDGPVERFGGFRNMVNHTGHQLVKSFIKFLEKNNIDIADYRGQSYDNACTMSGRYNGMQAKIHEINLLVMFII